MIRKSIKEKIVEQLDFFIDIVNGEQVKIRDCNFNPKTGIYLEDKELNMDTVFKPGTKIKYGIDTENKVLKIMPSDSVGTTVATRERNGHVSSVVHIRRKEIIDVFKDCSKLEFEIYENCIIVKNKDVDEKGDLKDSTQYSVSKKDIEALADKNVDESIRKVVANHTKKHPILQGLFNVIKEPIRFISLFSGIGAMDYAFQMETGFKCELAVEMNDSAVKSFKANSKSHIYHGDINNVDFDKVKSVQVVIGGPPCQDFSLQNAKRDEDSNRNKLVLKFAEVVKKVKATIFIIENVPQLLTTKASYYIKELKEYLPDFELSMGVLNSSDFGSAQSRDRAYIIGSKVGKIELPVGDHASRKTVKEAFVGITEDMPNAKDISKPTPITLERMKYVPQGGNWQDIPEELRTKGKFSNNFRRLSWNDQSCTIVNVGRTIIMHPEEHRVLSVREMARLFGLPDWFEFHGNMFDKQQQVANTIVVEVIRSIARKVKDKFEDLYDKRLMDRFSLQSL